MERTILTDEVILRKGIEIVPVADVVLSIEINLIHEVEDGAEAIYGRDRPIIRSRAFPISTTP